MKQQNLFDPELVEGELFCCSATKENFNNSFREHASFRSFLTLRKELRKLETIFNVIPSDNYLIIEAWNKHCKIRVAEKNNKVIYRLIKTSIKLYLKTLKVLFLK